MCARRLLIFIVLMTLLVIAGALAILPFRGRALTTTATPQGHYEPPPPQTGPDYGEAANWIARPDLPAADNPALWTPASDDVTSGGHRAHLFFVHPTTYLERDRWNATLDDRESRDRAA